MAKLSINANPTFKAKVEIPVAGGDPVEMELTFKHRTKDQLDEFIKSVDGRTDVETFTDMVIGWGFAEEFTPEAAATMLQNYIGAAVAAYRTYINQLVQAKAKN